MFVLVEEERVMSSRSRFVNRLSKRSAIVLAAASATASFSSSLWAVTGTFTYTAGGTSWTNANAWLFGNPYPDGIDQIANFTAVDLAPVAPTNYPINLNTNIVLGGLNFSDTNSATPGGWTLSPTANSTLTLATSSPSAQPVINVQGLGINPSVAFVEIAVPVFGTKGYNK